MDAEQVRRWREADRLFGIWLDQAPPAREGWLARLTLDTGMRATLQAQQPADPPTLPLNEREWPWLTTWLD